MTSSISGFSNTDSYSEFYNSPQFMQNELQNLGNDMQQQDAQWQQSQQQMVADLPSLQDAPTLSL